MEQRVRSHLNPEPAIPSSSRHLGLHENVQSHGIDKTSRGEIHDDDPAFIDESGKQIAELGGSRQIVLARQHDDGSVGLRMLNA